MKIEEQHDKLFRYCYTKTRNLRVAEDITQETFLMSLYISGIFVVTARVIYSNYQVEGK